MVAVIVVDTCSTRGSTRNSCCSETKFSRDHTTKRWKMKACRRSSLMKTIFEGAAGCKKSRKCAISPLFTAPIMNHIDCLSPENNITPSALCNHSKRSEQQNGTFHGSPTQYNLSRNWKMAGTDDAAGITEMNLFSRAHCIFQRVQWKFQSRELREGLILMGLEYSSFCEAILTSQFFTPLLKKEKSMMINFANSFISFLYRGRKEANHVNGRSHRSRNFHTR